MAEKTAIEWTDHTWSPWEGCTKVSPACDHCYAEGMNRWLRKGANWGPGAPRREFSDAHWAKPLAWNAKAARDGVRRRVFPSVCDPFDNEVPEEWRARFFSLIVATPHLDWLLLTKRIGNARRMLDEAALHVSFGSFEWEVDGGPMLHNVWLGSTVVNQAEADRDVPKLLSVPASVRFLSIEPMLGPIKLGIYGHRVGAPDSAVRGVIDWVICGGESGPKARPMHPEWVAQVRNQCHDAGVPFLFKQWGEWMPEAAMNHALRMRDCGQFESLLVKIDGRTHWIDADDHTQHDASDLRMVKVGKAAAGRLLDGRTHDEFPAIRAAKGE